MQSAAGIPFPIAISFAMGISLAIGISFAISISFAFGLSYDMGYLFWQSASFGKGYVRLLAIGHFGFSHRQSFCCWQLAVLLLLGIDFFFLPADRLHFVVSN